MIELRRGINIFFSNVEKEQRNITERLTPDTVLLNSNIEQKTRKDIPVRTC